MSTENVKIKCPAKPITCAFIYCKDNDERNKYVRSANMLRKELRGRKIFHQKRLGYIKCCIRTRHGTSLTSISLNRFSQHVSVDSVDGQVVVRTCQSGSLKYHKYQDIESEVEDYIEKWLAKKLVAMTVSSRVVGTKRREEGKIMSCHEYTETDKEQRDDKGTANGGGRHKLKHADGDFHCA